MQCSPVVFAVLYGNNVNRGYRLDIRQGEDMYAAIYRISSQILLTCTLLLIAACKTTEPPAPIIVQAPVVEPVKPPPPPPLFIAARPTADRMNEPLVRAAGNHAVLMTQITLIPTEDIRSPEHMNETMSGLSQVFSPSIGPALIGYGALIGAQSSEFVEGVIETARYEGIDSVVYQLYANPDYAANLPGASFASADIQNSWASDIANIDRSSEHIRSQSYSLQEKEQWKKKRADSRTERLEVIAQAKSLRFDPPQTTAQQIAEVGTIRADDIAGPLKRQQFWQTYGREELPQTDIFTSQYRGAMHRKALTLSALEILGVTGAESSEWIENYMTSPRLTQCVTTARLNTEQCIAAAHFKYEDAFCIAAHELKEISNCMSGSAL